MPLRDCVAESSQGLSFEHAYTVLPITVGVWHLDCVTLYSERGLFMSPGEGYESLSILWVREKGLYRRGWVHGLQGLWPCPRCTVPLHCRFEIASP